MDVWSAPPVDARSLFRNEREALLTLLGQLPKTVWTAPSAAKGWTVKDIALHLLDGDLGRLSRHRDGDHSGVLPVTDGGSLADALAAKNQRWIDAAKGLSPRVIRGLLAHSTREIEAWTAQTDMCKPARVSWAGSEPVPTWLDYAREFTETWVHHQQVREATGRPAANDRLPDVLGIFVWAFQHQYRVDAPTGVCVGIDLDTGGQWHLASQGESHWSLQPGRAASQAASLTFTANAAWRSLTGASFPDEEITSAGPERFIEPLLHVRGIIA